ncbi:uncharacterized protein BDZ99DRAFT_482637 [Mytilinidion resinicola]|uniref:Uncharacterized protein n=1 Tax=Mytilinidion resinicola TaxID=574789 RepID=A0A6A6Y1U7_9PEZI|nr:uncharacterized protein BDZ99DRAFT_482637 [Mytilinidion resinicola]KAF2802786.1 hypothetical protein BDZ99DRAFT_482637 [Mytilinidion resinicola]
MSPPVRVAPPKSAPPAFTRHMIFTSPVLLVRPTATRNLHMSAPQYRIEHYLDLRSTDDVNRIFQTTGSPSYDAAFRSSPLRLPVFALTEWRCRSLQMPNMVAYSGHCYN